MDHQRDEGSFSLKGLAMALLALSVVVGSLLFVLSRARHTPSTGDCSRHGEPGYLREFIMLIDQSASMQQHADVAERSFRAFLETLAPGDKVSAFQLRGTFDEQESRVLAFSEAAPVRLALAGRQASELEPACAGELAEQWSETRRRIQDWQKAAKLSKSTRECSAYFSAIQGVAAAAAGEDSAERWLIILGDLEAERLKDGKCEADLPAQQPKDSAQPFHGFSVVLAVPVRDGRQRFWQEQRAWEDYFRQRGARRVEVMPLDRFRYQPAAKVGTTVPAVASK